jgi:hypothetical protein
MALRNPISLCVDLESTDANDHRQLKETVVERPQRRVLQQHGSRGSGHEQDAACRPQPQEVAQLLQNTLFDRQHRGMTSVVYGLFHDCGVIRNGEQLLPSLALFFV